MSYFRLDSSPNLSKAARCGHFVYNMPQSPEAVAHAFVEAINKRDVDKLAELMSSADRLRTQGGMA